CPVEALESERRSHELRRDLLRNAEETITRIRAQLQDLRSKLLKAEAASLGPPVADDDLSQAVQHLDSMLLDPHPGLPSWAMVLNEVALKCRNELVRRWPLTAAECDETRVRHAIVELYTPEESDAWLTSPQVIFGGRKPMDLIRGGSVAQVLKGIESLKD